MTKSQQRNDFMQLYGPIHEDLSRFCTSLCHSSELAKDLLGDVVLKAFEHFRAGKSFTSFKNYIFGIASNTYKQSLRREKFHGPFHEESAALLPDHHTNSEAATDLSLLKALLQKLPIEQREAFVLHEINGFKLAEVAEIQKTSLSNAKQRAKRARDTLSKMLEEPEVVQESVPQCSQENSITLKSNAYERGK